MPNDTYTLTISDAGVTTPSAHASTHITGGSDAIQSATTSQNGLMTSAQVTSLTAAATFTSGSSNITTAKLVDNAVDSAKLKSSASVDGDRAVTTNHVRDLAITDAKLASSAVTTAKLADNAVDSAKLESSASVDGDRAVTTDHVRDLAITNAKIAENTIASSKLLNSSVDSTKLKSSASVDADRAVTTNHIQDLAVTNAKIAVETITSNKLALSTSTSTGISLGKIQYIPQYSIIGNDTAGDSATTYLGSSAYMLASTTGFLRQGSAADARSTLGLGGMATQSPASVAITGGTMSGVAITVNLSSGTTGTLPVTSGGTGKSLYEVGDIVYANTTTSLASLAATVTGNALISGGNGTAPAYGKIGLTTHVSGTLPAVNGGTGISLYGIGDIVYANTTTSLASLTATTTGNVLLSGGSATAPAYGKVGLTTHVSGILPIANGGTGSSTLPAANVTTATGILPIANGGTGSSTFPAANVSTATGVLPIANGGTGSTTLPAANVTTATGILPVANGGTGYGSDGIGTLTFDTTPSTAVGLTEGQLRWNTTDQTLDLKMAGAYVTQQIGQELLMRVHAGETVDNGYVYYIGGSNIGLPEVFLATCDDINCTKILGVGTEDFITGEDGYITLNGIVRGLNLSGFTAGQEVFLSDTGTFTATAPAYPNYKVRVGYVVNASDGDGSLYVSLKYFENGLVNGTGKLGYVTGAGGDVTQLTSKSTGVTLDKACGKITLNGAALAGNTVVSFVLTNDRIEAGDILILNHTSVGTFGAYTFNARAAAGSTTIDVRNATNGSLSEAIVISFAVIKAVSA